MKIILSFAIILLFSGNIYAADCSTIEKMDAADTAASSIKNWNDAYSFFHNFKQCDDGYIAEGLSATLTHMLANRWHMAPQLDAMFKKDKAFEAWVLNHMNTTVDDRDLEIIVTNAEEKCPDGGKPFCSKVKAAASQALQELAE
jgi:hypothetical protein